MDDVEKKVTLDVAAKLEAEISSLHGAGVPAAKLQKLVDMANEMKVAAGVGEPLLKLEDAPVEPVPEPAPAPVVAPEPMPTTPSPEAQAATPKARKGLLD